MAKISIVVPVYNAASYITRCINSILGQTFTEFQAVLVNDGSTDDSAAIIKESIKDDPRFILINKENGGVSAARNTGLKHVTAEWVTFLDSDDWLGEKYFEALLAAAGQEAHIDMVLAGYRRVNNSGTVLYTKKFEQAIVAANDYPTLFNQYHLHDYGYCWAKLFRKEILDRGDSWFNTNISLYEDTLFIFEYLKHTNKVCFMAGINYNYLENQQSITNRKRDFNFSYLPFRALADFTFENFGTGIEMINRRWAIYMNDALISNYTLSQDKNERLKNLDKFKPEDWELYKSHFQPFNVFFALFKMLLMNKKVRVADFLMKNYFKLRS